ncbi:M15 family metallopeptidase [Actinoplanes sp. TRM 88003]|uniref:M15 family metallopeptidase n=1 Tax=Paractinoplanes aksuensis TaxID=2939490 RepID=A0ABT1E2D8_9ACTN|nr:M15 family metallopeptidase [Actinoplanes aksuensis]MCO8277294.1 M15 family metallopeptidase [Actinoplanes aksuensis]
MTTRQELRPNPRIRARARRAITAPIFAALAVGLAVGANPVPVQAAPPAVAQEWGSLMYRSLTRQQTLATLRSNLTMQQTAAVTRNREVAAATTALTAAQNQVTSAGTGLTAARARQAGAQTGLATAQQNLTKAQKKRPVSKAAVTKAKNAVAAAGRALAVRRTQTQTAATTLVTAQATARTAAGTLTAATTAREALAAALAVTQNRIATLPTAGDYATKAATMSKDVVNQTRPGFVVADTMTVYGTTVHKSVAYAFKRMVDDARANGIAISGGGFRTKERQIELRKINGCPDVWTAPSSSCRVPTAVPGRSLHELGMAVDITSGGKTLTRSSPAYKWLVLHAKAYGFVNLPSEPWHWSITGG